MEEELEIYDLDDGFLHVQDRKQFYNEIKEEFERTGKITRQVKTIRLFLMNSQGRIYLQKRSKLKGENPGLIDKTVGGHVTKDDSFDMTCIRECAEELGFPASILPEEAFNKAIRVTDLNIVGIVKRVDHISNFQSVRITKEGNRFVQPHLCRFYIGYYDGPIKFVDGESSGVEAFSLEELKEEIKNNPERFTEDIKFMIKKYEHLLKPVINE